jgi:type VI secretion system protein VasG
MSIPRRKLFGKLNITLFKGLESAAAYCKLRGNPYIELVHWLYQIWQLNDSDMHRIAKHFGLHRETLESDILAAILTLPSGAGSISDFSHHIEHAIERSWIEASLSKSDNQVRSAWLLCAIMDTSELRRVLYGISKEFKKIDFEKISTEIHHIISESPENNDQAQDQAGMTDSEPGEASQAFEGNSVNKSALDAYSSDLTKLARDNKIDPVIGRFQEIRSIVDILLRRRQNNPLLTGEAGVGKTAVIEGLALAIVNQQVPPELHNVRLLSLDMGALIAGASMRGEFESRLKKLLQEAMDSPVPIVLFIDEIHTIVGAGGHTGTGDAANLLKPALARGGLRTIGATTWSEYKKHIEKDPALTRRFQVLQILEPQETTAIDMVRGISVTFSRHHRVHILDEAVVAAVKLSHRYIPARQLPDKAISLLDTACARVALSRNSPPTQIDFLRHQRLALETEHSFIKAQSVLQGLQATSEEDPLISRIAKLEQTLADLNLELAQKETHWDLELKLINQLDAVAKKIQNLRHEVLLETTETVKNSSIADLTDLSTLQQEFLECKSQLKSLQLETGGLVFPFVDEIVIGAIVSEWTGIPVGRMQKDDVHAVLNLQAKLSERVKGQDHALLQICERIRMSKAKITDPSKPVGVFMLVGPSGVGKTETALALAENLYGGEQNLITINMSEFQEPHTVSTLKGAPPGYVGYGEGGVLTEAIRRKPYSVVLLDEIEKAHPDVLELFFQIFDKGWMEDGEGRYIDFKNTLILLTSNAGESTINQMCEDSALIPTSDVLLETISADLRKHFPTAFLGRMKVIPYFPLQSEMLRQIIELQLNRIVERMKNQHNIQLNIESSVTNFITNKCGQHETGARRIQHYLNQHILPKISDLWLYNLDKKPAMKAMHIRLMPQTNESSSAETIANREASQISELIFSFE